MTDLMQVLYEYVEAERLPAYLPPREYQEVRKLTDRLSRQLREMLPEDRWDTLAKYQDAAAELHTINYRQYEDPRIDHLVETISQAAQALKE